jgi:hypothetical protein
MSKQTDLINVTDAITVSGSNVGIGTSSPTSILHVKGRTLAVDGTAASDSPRLNLDLDGTNKASVLLNRVTEDLQLTVVGSNDMTFTTNASEAARIDSSGNLLVGKTSTSSASAGVVLQSSGLTLITRDDATPASIRRNTSDGDLLAFTKDGTTVGSIGVVSGLYTYFNSENNTGFLASNGTLYYGWNTTTFYPNTDNARDLGISNRRWDDIYATNGTIQTSDRNEKQDIEALSDAEQRVAVACKGLLRKFRWIDSVAEKGDAARIHFGIIAQDLQDAFAAEGLDAGRYAMFISSTWTDEETGEERTRLGVRYPELLAFIIGAM